MRKKRAPRAIIWPRWNMNCPTQIKSPIDGTVVSVNVHTVGGVIQPGFHIMDVVPLNEPMIVETRIRPT